MDLYDDEAHLVLVVAIILIIASFLLGAFCGARF